MIEVGVKVEFARALDMIANAEKKTSRKALRAGVRASAKVYLDAVKRMMPRGETGLLRRSIAMRSGGSRAAVGQRKRRYKERKKGSQINRKGYAAPIHFIERPTKSHRIKALRILHKAMKIGRGKGAKIRAAVNHPGTKAALVLPRARRASQSAAKSAFTIAVYREFQK